MASVADIMKHQVDQSSGKSKIITSPKSITYSSAQDKDEPPFSFTSQPGRNQHKELSKTQSEALVDNRAKRKPLLVTRRRNSSFKEVPLTPHYYPFDITKSKPSSAVKTQQSRKRWQTVVYQDIVSPNIHKVDRSFVKSVLKEPTAE